MARNHSQGKKQPQYPTVLAQPVIELLYSSAVLGEDFRRVIRPSLPETTAHNANALFHFMALSVSVLGRATKGNRTPAVKECLTFLRDLRDDFEQIASNAADVLNRYKEVKND